MTRLSSSDIVSYSRAAASASSVPCRSSGSSTASEIRVVASKNGSMTAVYRSKIEWLKSMLLSIVRSGPVATLWSMSARMAGSSASSCSSAGA